MKYSKINLFAEEKAKVARAATEEALKRMVESGSVIDFAAVAREAGVSRKYLYEQADLREFIITFRTTTMSKDELRKELYKLRSRNRLLEEALKKIKANLPKEG